MRISATTLLLGTLSLFGCGDIELGGNTTSAGGGSGGGGSIPTDAASLTGSNAISAAGAAILGMDQTDNGDNLVIDNIKTVVDGTTAVGSVTIAQLHRVLPANANPSFGSTSGTLYCGSNPATESGKGTLKWTLVDTNANLKLDSSDSLTLVWDACKTSNTVTLTGTIKVTSYLATGADDLETGNGSLGFTSTFTDFTTSNSASTPASVKINGGIGYAYTSTDSIVTSVVNASSLTAIVDSETIQLSNYSSQSTFTVATTAYSTTLQGTIASTDIDGVATLSTVSALKGQLTSNKRPTEGVIKLTGDKSSMTITVQDTSTLVLDVDIGNDGSIDATKTTTYTEALAATAN